MFELIIANLTVRPLRTLISVLGVAIGVVLVVLFTGLTEGMSNDMAKRAANWKAEIVFTRPGAMTYDSSNAPLPTAYADRLMQIEGVASVVPVIRYITSNSKSTFGLQQLDGVDWEPFAEMNEMHLVSGRAPKANNEIVVDERQLVQDGLKLGDQISLLGDRKYDIVGVYSPPSGARIKMTLAAMQEVLEAPNKATYILVKIDDGAYVNQVAARINEELPGNTINLTQDLVIDAQDRVPGVKTFLRVLVGLGAFVSTVFVLLSMYTTITERKKEIGILKSLGASTSFIIRSIEGEAFMIGIFGILAGLAASLIGSVIIERGYELGFEFSAGWMAWAVMIAIGGSLLGALYPAWRASSIDPVEVMANE
ncbi:MAG TPA: ABC transporter permease [Pyrinomonadaceae bacterium]|jgi:putative ABC transport system permease protein|nr:ABC transporter permease [Pyrinomonadaceae bacterium]